MSAIVRRLQQIGTAIVKGQSPFVRWKPHPIDAEYGISTSSYERYGLLATGDATIDTNNIGYVGSQPSIVRRAIDVIPDKPGKVFIDLGCGKGRTLAVASEYPFRRIVGIEIVPKLARIAGDNAAAIRHKYPERAPIETALGDATDLAPFRDSELLLFLYNSFRAPLVERLVSSITSLVEHRPERTIYVAYYNPVHFRLFDDNPVFERFAAEKLKFTAAEAAVRPFGNDFDSIVVYRAGRSDGVPPHPGHDRAVVLTQVDYGAEVIH